MQSKADNKKRKGRFIIMILSLSLLLSGCSSNKNAVSENDNIRTYYEVFVYSFCDSNGDGIGDLKGLDSKLDYISGLGFTGIWLMPICPAMSYHKYDVTDYMNIDPQYGTLEDYEKLVKDCHKRNIKVINDLVINHTGSGHPWFVKASAYLKAHPDTSLKEAAEACPEAGYYNFAKANGTGYHKLDNTGWYYESQFSSKMPDLNLDNPAVRSQIKDIMQFWTDKGADGFRLDAAKEYYTGNSDKNTEMLEFLQKTVDGINPDAYMVAEIWDSYSSIIKYYKSGITSIFDYPFGNSDGQIIKTLHGAGNASRVSKYAENLEKADTAYADSNASYIDAPFLSNHDTGRIEGFVNGDEGKLKLAGAMNLFMSGTAFVYYGEELGMSGSGNDPSKRSPMYWSSTDTKGMTSPPPECTAQEHKFGAYDEQKKEEGSIYNYYKKAIAIRNKYPVISHGHTACEKSLNKGCISAIKKTYGNEEYVILMNISDKSSAVEMKTFSSFQLKESLCVSSDEAGYDGKTLTLPAYGVAIFGR